jgi:hypothetical protein
MRLGRLLGPLAPSGCWLAMLPGGSNSCPMAGPFASDAASLVTSRLSCSGVSLCCGSKWANPTDASSIVANAKFVYWSERPWRKLRRSATPLCGATLTLMLSTSIGNRAHPGWPWAPFRKATEAEKGATASTPPR